MFDFLEEVFGPGLAMLVFVVVMLCMIGAGIGGFFGAMVWTFRQITGL